ncbi:Transcriptional activator ARO80 [Paramyrothecium foliicola]|nr:Transcriptional activator ARO80 [Paramyrothecium foliicola]
MAPQMPFNPDADSRPWIRTNAQAALTGITEQLVPRSSTEHTKVVHGYPRSSSPANQPRQHASSVARVSRNATSRLRISPPADHARAAAAKCATAVFLLSGGTRPIARYKRAARAEPMRSTHKLTNHNNIDCNPRNQRRPSLSSQDQTSKGAEANRAGNGGDSGSRRGSQSADSGAVSSHRPFEQSRTNSLREEDNAAELTDNNAGQIRVGGIADSMLRTVVASGKDAMNLLFEAAQHRADIASNNDSLGTDMIGPDGTSTVGGLNASPMEYSTPLTQPVMSSNLSADVIECWKAYRFTKMGWFSAEEAITLTLLTNRALSCSFFRNTSPLTPIVDDFYADHSNHYALVTREPLLCAVLLTISSRYNVLPVSGGESRGQMIHARLWDHCQHLILRILLGQEKRSKAKTRTLGSIEALLLLTEWQPRALHAPPAADGWDSDVMLTLEDRRDEGVPDVDNPSRGRWMEDVIMPARRFDRMAWMIIGLAMSLAQELGIYETEDTAAGTETMTAYDRRFHRRRKALAGVLYSQQEQLSARLGRRAMIPPIVSHGAAAFNPAKLIWEKRGENWPQIMAAWMELGKLSRSISDIIFPSATVTKHLLQSGRYVNMIEHFCVLLADWEKRHGKLANVDNGSFAHILSVEYHYSRIYANSLGLQAVVERTMAEPRLEPRHCEFEVGSIDYGFIQAVVDGSLKILKVAIKMHEQNSLRFAPVTIYLRITTASVFLLKGLGLGVSSTKLRDSLEVLTSAITALRNSRPDDLHLGSSYATLLEIHVSRLKGNFVPALRPPRFATRPGSEDGDNSNEFAANFEDPDWLLGLGSTTRLRGAVLSTDDSYFPEDWMTLPFDPSLQPYCPDEMQDFQLLGDTSLDFVWNMTT